MSRDHFWLTDRQFARIAPHLPTDTRVPRVDDRRVISGIVHVLKSGATPIVSELLFARTAPGPKPATSLGGDFRALSTASRSPGAKVRVAFSHELVVTPG